MAYMYVVYVAYIPQLNEYVCLWVTVSNSTADCAHNVAAKSLLHGVPLIVTLPSLPFTCTRNTPRILKATIC